MCCRKYTRENGAVRKKYRMDHLTELKKYDKQYYMRNIEKRKEYKSGKIICFCGISVGRSSLARHQKNNRHISRVAKMQLSDVKTFLKEAKKNLKESQRKLKKDIDHVSRLELIFCDAIL